MGAFDDMNFMKQITITGIELFFFLIYSFVFWINLLLRMCLFHFNIKLKEMLECYNYNNITYTCYNNTYLLDLASLQ